MELFSDSPDKTIAIGRTLGELAGPGSVICVEGNLGAGKTHFAKGVALGLGVEDHVTSPTFTIINEYEGRCPFFHVDAYRLEDDEEAYGLGLEEYIYGVGVTLIEWPGRISRLLPDQYLAVTIGHQEDTPDGRNIVFRGVGSGYDSLIRDLSERFTKELKSCVCSGN